MGNIAVNLLEGAFGFDDDDKPNKHDFSKQVMVLKKAVEKALGLQGGKDVTDSSSDLIRIEWKSSSFTFTTKQLSSLSKLDILYVSAGSGTLSVSVQK